jgi:hypothetical protein
MTVLGDKLYATCTRADGSPTESAAVITVYSEDYWTSCSTDVSELKISDKAQDPCSSSQLGHT